MFKLAFRMFCSDIRTMFQGWFMSITGIVFLLLLVITPFIADQASDSPMMVYMFVYCNAYTLMWLSPRFVRSFHVVPLTIGQIKQLAIFRTIIFVMISIAGGCVFLILAKLFDWNWNIRFGLWYFIYAEFYLIGMNNRLLAFQEKTKTNIPLAIFSTVIIGASIFAVYGVFDMLPLYAEYLIQAGLFILFIPQLVFVSKRMDFYDYRQVPGFFAERLQYLE